MLETPEERVKLLKAGISGKAIEKLYLVHNRFKIVKSPVLFEMVEVEGNGNQDCPIICEACAGYCCI